MTPLTQLYFMLLLFPAVIWLFLVLPLWNKLIEMDFGVGGGNFFHVFKLWQRIFWVIFGVSLPSSFILLYYRLEGEGATLLAAAISAFLFNGLLTYFYEGYLHAKYPYFDPSTLQSPCPVGRSNYSGRRYALILTLGITSVFYFFLGIVGAFSAFAQG